MALADDLRNRGVRQGDRVVTALPNSVGCVVAQLAIRVCGAVLVNLPAQFRREIVEICDQTDARLVVLPAEAAAEKAFATLGDRSLFLTRDLADTGSTVEPALRRRDDVAWLAFTSGTTGSPKGAVHTEETLALMVEAMIDRHDVGPDDVVVVAAPMGHAIGFVYGMQLALRAGCPMAVLSGWDVAPCDSSWPPLAGPSSRLRRRSSSTSSRLSRPAHRSSPHCASSSVVVPRFPRPSSTGPSVRSVQELQAPTTVRPRPVG